MSVLFSPYPLSNFRISSVWSVGTVTMPCLQRIVSIPISGLGNLVVPLVLPTLGKPLGHLLTSVLLPSIFTIPVRMLPLIVALNCRSSSWHWWFRFPTLPSLCGNLSRQKFDVDMEQSPLLVVLKIVDSLFSPPSPPDRPGSRDDIPCWWCCIVTAQKFHPNLKKILLVALFVVC